jgi:hypothetical protein
MHMASRVFLLLCASCAGACQAPVATVPITSPIGLSGGPITDGVDVVAVDEATGAPIAGATVTCGDAAPITTTLGSAVRCPAGTSGTADIVVSAPGQVTERWIGIARANAVVGLTPRVDDERTLHGAITGASDRASIGVSSRFGIVRSGDVTGGAAACVDASDCSVALTASPVGAHDMAIVDHGAMRLVLVREVPTEADGGFAIDVLAQSESAPLIDLSVTLPDANGLTEVVGVPGLSTANGVALLGAPSEGTSTLAPVREGSLAGEGLWFVARARTADGTGESFALDRDVPIGSADVMLAPAFLAVPIASRAGDVVTVQRESGSSLYVIESSDAAGVVERALAFSTDPSFDVRAAGARVRVRVLDAAGSGDVDLGRVAADTTRFADRVL